MGHAVSSFISHLTSKAHMIIEDAALDAVTGAGAVACWPRSQCTSDEVPLNFCLW